MTMNSYKKVKKEYKHNFKLLKQLISSLILFLCICLVAKLSPGFHKIAADYTKKNTNFASLYEIVSQRVEQCFEDIRTNVEVE